MSKRINVNPNFYKTGGREHAEGHGEAIVHDREKQQMSHYNGYGKVLPGQKSSAKRK
jgi:hypothetical protein